MYLSTMSNTVDINWLGMVPSHLGHTSLYSDKMVGINNTLESLSFMQILKLRTYVHMYVHVSLILQQYMFSIIIVYSVLLTYYIHVHVSASKNGCSKCENEAISYNVSLWIFCVHIKKAIEKYKIILFGYGQIQGK